MQNALLYNATVTYSLENFSRYLDDVFRKNRRSTASVPQHLYHYTTPAGLVGIVKNQQLWASNVEFLNDTSEPSHAFHVIETAFDGVKKTADVSDKVKELLDSFWNWTTSDRAVHGPHLYVFCFCEHGDLLSQWRSYGVRGSGCAIGFAAQALQSLLRVEEGQYLIKTEYEEGRQFEEAQSVLREIIAFVSSVERKVGPLGSAAYSDHLNLYLNKVRTALHSEVIRLCAKFKSPAFREEREWRILQFLPPRTDHLDVKFRATESRIVPYVELEFSADENRLPIDRVVVGPTMGPGAFHNSVRVLFDACRYDNVEVIDSVVPFRG